MLSQSSSQLAKETMKGEAKAGEKEKTSIEVGESSIGGQDRNL